MKDDDQGIYFMNPTLSEAQLRIEAEGLLMSVVVSIDLLQQQFGTLLSGEPQQFLKTLYNCMVQFFLMYDAVFPLQSADAKMYDTQALAFILNPALSERKCQDTLRGIAFQLTALCEEGLKTTLLEHLTDRGGNLLMHAAMQAQMVRHAIEVMQMKQPPKNIA